MDFMTTKRKKSKQKGESKQKISQTKKFQNLFKMAREFVISRKYKPLTEEEFIEKLDIHDHHLDVFRVVLEALVEQQLVEFKQGKYWKKGISEETVSGVIRMHHRGFGFVQADDSDAYPKDIFIPKPYTQNAVDGDRVEVTVHPDAVSPKGPEGKVTAITARGRTHVAGTIHGTDRYGNVLAYVPIMGSDKKVIVHKSQEFQLKVGDRLVLEILDWGDQDDASTARVAHYIGHISDPSCDIRAAIEEYELRSDFPAGVKAEATTFGSKVTPKDIKGREDLRELECFTIDPKTAKDFDDALTLSKDSNGHYHLGVHIADVSHYVKSGSLLDEEAKRRCNSTYFPGTCIPMLPPELSESLCSLKPRVNRLASTVFMEFDSNGTLIKYRFARTVIKSAKRFTYSEAKEVLDGKKQSVHAPTLHLMVELCHHLKAKRYERGSIEFALPELRILIDEKGVPTGTEYISYDITHQLVEEFMLKANEVVALHLSEKGVPVAFRVHEQPAEDSLRDFSILAGAFGFQLSETPTPEEIQTLFNEALDTEYGQYLATSYIRRMRLAVYSPDNIGHYGLNLTHYCHFTSPIRRYVDLVIHRSLFGEAVEKENLEVITAFCSEQERISEKAENSVIMLKKLRLLYAIHKEDPYKTYTAVVTRVRPFGVFFEILDYMMEGFFSLSDLESDYYVYNESKGQLLGQHTGTTLQAGHRFEVMLSYVDFITLESKWIFACEEPSRNSRPKKKKRRY